MIEPSVQATSSFIKNALSSYIESQYFLRDRSLFFERRSLMQEPGAIAQTPYIEATPYYHERSEGFAGLDLPEGTSAFLDQASRWPGSGVFPTPFRHQAEALEAGLEGGQDVLVASGTGSGKTEAFLWSILARCEAEARTRPSTWSQPGFRALILYPMNALVSDQLGRLRRTFGQSRIREHFLSRFQRPIRFGMYTSRTPYAGVRSRDKDKARIGRVMKVYLGVQRNDPDQMARLKEAGRWPAKDLPSFEAAGWETDSGDAELYTRHEIQDHSPDVLITNYSMLEYMLLRPIEAPIFEQTRAWLAAHPSNVLTLVVDEAHLYRGTTGAEVGLLLRRLYHRLGIDRSKVRCILTSASLGTGEDSEAAMRLFAQNLVGEQTRGIRVVTATPLNIAAGASLSFGPAEVEALAGMDLASLYCHTSDPARFRNALRTGLAASLGGLEGMPEAPQEGLRWLGERMASWAPMDLLIRRVSGKALPFGDLAQGLFPGQALGPQALERLLALGAVARHPRGGGDRPLVPVRAHLLYRGIPSLFACINPACDQRRTQEEGGNLLGKLHTSSRIQCECGARVFELLAHRDCGTPFLQIFLGDDGTFAWHEGSRADASKPRKILVAVPEPDAEPRLKRNGYQIGWIHIWTGKIVRSTPPSGSHDFLKVWFPVKKADGGVRWGHCPACKRGRDQESITTLATKGEEPIGALIRAQFQAQPAIRKTERLHPNGGRKLLVFSDGRQAAAKLALHLPEEAQRDAFRETLALALNASGTRKLDHETYIAFVGEAARNHLHFFSGPDQEQCLKHQDRFLNEFGGSLEDALGAAGEDRLLDPGEVPKAFYGSLLAFLADPFHSPFDLGLVVLEPSKQVMARLQQAGAGAGLTMEDLRAIAGLFLEHQVRNGSIFVNLRYFEKREALRAFRLRQTTTREFPEALTELLTENNIPPGVVEALAGILFDNTCEFCADDGVFYLRHPRVRIQFPAAHPAYLCQQCGRISLLPFRAHCSRCHSKRLILTPEGDPLVEARRGLVLGGVRQALASGRPSFCLSAEEHTAQLSYKDPEEANTTLEDHELRFQGLPLKNASGQLCPPVDVLSCTTTMEVGIDIGSLTAVAMRNVPPRRENYQQRAGRAGRRGSALSTVVTYAQGGSYDAHSFLHPEWLVSGTPAPPRTQVCNETLARRHIRGHVLHSFFSSQPVPRGSGPDLTGLSTVFGKTGAFLEGAVGAFSLAGLRAWFGALTPAQLAAKASWLPFGAKTNPALYGEATLDFLDDLEQVRAKASWQGDPAKENLLDCLFEEGWMPRYAFPMDVVSLHLFEAKHNRVCIKEKPQQALGIALSEYAPGRLVTVDKELYQIGGLFVPGSTGLSQVKTRIQELLERPQTIVSCPNCTYLKYYGGASGSAGADVCPLCGAVLEQTLAIRPPGFSPRGGRSLTKIGVDEVFTWAEGAQFPLPDEPETLPWTSLNPAIRCVHRSSQQLIAWNRGDQRGGFSICATCGATEPMALPPGAPHRVPFLVLGSQECPNPEFQSGNSLFYRFPTDLLALQVSWASPMAFSLEEPWWEDAMITLVEALRIAASRHLDIDPDELKGGYRLVPNETGSGLVAEFFLYDTAAGGAGYAEKVGLDLQRVLARTLDILEGCSNPTCVTSCRDCLENPGNKNLHPFFERQLAGRLLRFALHGEVPGFFGKDQVTQLLRPLMKWAELEGQAGPTRIRPFPAGLSRAWVEEQPAFAGAIAVTDHMLRRDLPAVRELSRGLGFL